MDTATDVIDLLLRDHAAMRALTERIDTVDDPVELRSLYLQLVEQLAAHETAEQQVLFPAYRLAVGEDADDTLARRMGEHDELNLLLAEMRELRPMGFGFVKRGSALVHECREHFAREEETVFARIREHVAGDELLELGERAAEAKRGAPAFPT
jgi:iron-sulfur cluster repair protein YtfE (RIC family)